MAQHHINHDYAAVEIEGARVSSLESLPFHSPFFSPSATVDAFIHLFGFGRLFSVVIILLFYVSFRLYLAVDSNRR